MKPSLVSADTALLRRLNTQAVLDALREAGSLTLTELARLTGLSRQTVGAALDDLIERGLCEAMAPREGRSGRPARRFAFRRRAGHAVGLSIAPRHVLVVVSDLSGEIVARGRCELDQKLAATERLAAAEELAVGCTAQAGPVWAAAAGTSGVVDLGGRVAASTQLPGWVGLDLAGVVGEWFGCPGYAGNDAALAVLAERWRGNARHVEDAALLLTGHRTGYGLLIDGHLHLGRHGAAGELGRLPGSREHDPALTLDREGVTAGWVVQAANAGDERALGLMEELGERLARGAAVLVATIDPDLVVIGGSLAGAGELLLDPLRRHLRTLCQSTPEVTTSALGDESVALGAVRVALDQIEERALLLGPAETYA